MHSKFLINCFVKHQLHERFLSVPTEARESAQEAASARPSPTSLISLCFSLEQYWCEFFYYLRDDVSIEGNGFPSKTQIQSEEGKYWVVLLLKTYFQLRQS